jgi:hypothetical protein
MPTAFVEKLSVQSVPQSKRNILRDNQINWGAVFALAAALFVKMIRGGE